jgi:hypothetical protein
MFENRVLKIIFAPKRGEVRGGWWRKLHNEELFSSYSPANIVKIMK